jgi:hypothetical protein
MGNPAGRANAFLRERYNDALTAIFAFDLQRPSCAFHRCSDGSSGKLTGALIMREAHEGCLNLSSYLAARSSSRLLVKFIGLVRKAAATRCVIL